MAYRNISIISKLDEIVKENIYITREENDKPGYIPLIEYKRLIKNFPNTTEVTKYAHARITQILSNYISESERINEKYEKYLLKKSDYSSNMTYPDLDLLSLNLFQTALDKM